MNWRPLHFIVKITRYSILFNQAFFHPIKGVFLSWLNSCTVGIYCYPHLHRWISVVDKVLWGLWVMLAGSLPLAIEWLWHDSHFSNTSTECFEQTPVCWCNNQDFMTEGYTSWNWPASIVTVLYQYRKFQWMQLVEFISWYWIYSLLTAWLSHSDRTPVAQIHS